MENLKIRSFKNGIIDLMNNTCLPAETKRLVLVDVLQETTRLADLKVKDEIEAWQKEQAEAEKSNPENSPE